MPVTINGSSGITDVNGTAAAPALTGTDTDSGVWFPAANTVAFSTNGAETMRIDSSGNVGIGTASPASILQVSKASANPTVNITRTTSSAQTLGESLYLRLNDTVGVSSRTEIGMGYGIPGTTVYTPALIGYVQTSSSGQTYGDLYFATRTATTDTAPTERMRIDSSGYLYVRTTTRRSSAVVSIDSTTGTTNGMGINASGTSSSGMIVFSNPNGDVGSISTSGSATTYATSSDYRLKENIAPMTGALAKVAQLNPVTYNWKVDGEASEGFIAHELQTVVPQCVTGEKDAVDADGNPIYQGIDTSFLVATLTAAIKEQQAIITQLQADVAALKGKA